MHNSVSDLLSDVKHGTLPSKWQLVPLRSLVLKASYGLNNPSDEGGNASILGMKNIRDGRLDVANVSRVRATKAELQSCLLRRGNLLINRTNSIDLVGKVALVERDLDHVFASYLVRLIIDERRVDPSFLCYWLSGRATQKLIRRLATAAVGQANLNITDFQKHCLVPLPSIPTQRHIAEILRTWDKAIELAERLIAAKIKARDAFHRTAIGNGHGAHKRADFVALSNLVARVRTSDDGAGHPVLTISGRSGFLRQDEKYGRFMAGKSVEDYTLLRRGEFSYNKGNSTTYPQGCVYRLDVESGLVPHVYVSFRLISGELESDYFAHLCRSGFLNHQLYRLINSGVRNNGLLNITADEFFTCRIPVPPLARQKAIAGICNAADREISILEQRRDALAKQKRGLMQKLLTGEWAVSITKSREAAA